MIIGICGKSGCGKSTLSREIINVYKDTAIHLDIDKVGHKVLTIQEVQKELINCFGDSIATGDTIDRKRLGEMVFNSRGEMDKLSDITWKYMQIEIDKFLEENNDKIVVLDWLLLPLSKYFNMCNLKILLDIPYEVRKIRAMKRDNISSDAFDLREKASIDFDSKDFDYVVQNDSLEEIKRLVKLLW